jgi:NADH-quinone oxidoreductase subunit L
VYYNLAISILYLPLISGLINGLFYKRLSRTISSIISSTAIFCCFIASSLIFYDCLISENTYHFRLWEWLSIKDSKIYASILIDSLSSLMCLIVTLVSFVVHLYSTGYMREEDNFPKFMSFLSLFTFFMLCLICADNFLQLFFGWEGVGLCSYLLIGYYYHKESANHAAMKAFVTNRVSDLAFILGIIIIFLNAGSLNFAEVFTEYWIYASSPLHFGILEFRLIELVCLLLFIGCMGKSAQIGLHVWLPDAMEGPTPVSALIHAATMVTAGVFLSARCSYLFANAPLISELIILIGGITCLFGAAVALCQTDIKKIIAYSTCSQLGYMFMACGASAYDAGIFHLVTHATFKALLFLCAGNIIHSSMRQEIFDLGGLRTKMPVTYLYFVLASLAISGIYPLAGYYSKDMILEEVYSAGKIGKIGFGLGIFSAMLTAIYSFKILVTVFHGKISISQEEFNKVHEAPIIMNAPLLLLLAGTIFSGMIGYHLLGITEGYFGDSIYIKETIDHHQDTVLIKMMPSIFGILGILIGIYVYTKQIQKSISSSLNLVYKLCKAKFYFDELYNHTLGRMTRYTSAFSESLDLKVIDRFISSYIPSAIKTTCSLVSYSQNGYLIVYITIMISGVLGYVTMLLL